MNITIFALLLVKTSLAAEAPTGFDTIRAQMVKKAEAELAVQQKNVACLKAAAGPEAMMKCGEERHKATQELFRPDLNPLPLMPTSVAPPGPPAGTALVLPKFEAAPFEKALKAGEPVALVFSKPDCPVCLRQAPALKGVLAEKEFQHVRVFQAEFLKSAELAKRFGVNAWSTIVLLKGGKEVLRMQGTTEPVALREGLKRLK